MPVRDEVDAERLGGALRSFITPNKCRICGCEGDHCTLRTGEKCVLTGEFQDLCSAESCQWEAYYKRNKAKRERMRRGRRGRAA